MPVMTTMTLLKPSPHLVTLVQHFEGLRLSAYLDVAGVKTIGYGHTGTDFALSDTWTEEQCENAMRRDLAFACAAVDKLVKVELTQGQYDALADFCYNAGAGKLAGSTLLRLTNAGRLDEAAEEFPKWCRAGNQVLRGLVARRNAELNLWNDKNFSCSTT